VSRVALLVAGALVACTTTGTSWVAEPAGSARAGSSTDPRHFEPPVQEPPRAAQRRSVTRIVPAAEEDEPRFAPDGVAEQHQQPGSELGTFRNTYYNFPSQRNYHGAMVSLFDGKCRTLARVPAAFHDTLCVQGSGSLESGRTVSFARRNCECARTCPRTGQKICFDTLDRERFPWGRGAAGTAIVPLRSVAVDVSVIPLGTPLYIPEYAGLPLDRAGHATHDGCFLAEDRGIAVVGKHVDVFTGDVSVTRLWDGLVPTNRGVTVFVDSPHCPGAGH
jgi:3D (Asp-Asp-Asp) domain-containing protein